MPIPFPFPPGPARIVQRLDPHTFEACPDCDGAGFLGPRRELLACPRCDGSGLVSHNPDDNQNTQELA